jgi:ribosomal protein L40E
VKKLLLVAKSLSESIKNTLGFFIMITAASLYLMIGSLITFLIGAMIALKPEQRVVVQAAPQAKYCSECGAQNSMNANNCSQCGKTL